MTGTQLHALEVIVARPRARADDPRDRPGRPGRLRGGLLGGLERVRLVTEDEARAEPPTDSSTGPGSCRRSKTCSCSWRCRGAAGDHPPGPHLVPKSRLSRRSLESWQEHRSLTRLALAAADRMTSSRATRARRRCASSSWSRRARGWCCWAPITRFTPCAPTQRRRSERSESASGPSCSASAPTSCTRTACSRSACSRRCAASMDGRARWCSPGRRSQRAAPRARRRPSLPVERTG